MTASIWHAAAKRNIAVGHSPGGECGLGRRYRGHPDAGGDAAAAARPTIMCAAATGPAAKPSPMMRPQAGMPGRRIGVYGMGEIGRKIAARVAGFETEVGYFSRSKHDVPYRYFPSSMRWRNGAAS